MEEERQDKKDLKDEKKQPKDPKDGRRGSDRRDYEDDKTRKGNDVELAFQNITRDLVQQAKHVPTGGGFNIGTACIHCMLDIAAVVEKGFILTKGSITKIIEGVCAASGYPVDSVDDVDNIYNHVVEVLYRSAFAQASLLKMWQVQTAKNTHDVDNLKLGSVLFGPKANVRLEDLNNNEISEDFNVFNLSISNESWKNDYIDQLQYTYSSDGLRDIMVTMFAPCFELSRGLKGTTTYANFWPQDFFGEAYTPESVRDKFRNAIQTIRDITTGDPRVGTVLSSLGFKSGFAFDFTRDLGHNNLWIAPDNGLAELIISFSEGYLAPGHEQDEANFLASMLYLDDSTPIDIDTTAATHQVSLINAMRTNTKIWNICYSMRAVNRDGVGAWHFYQEPYLAAMEVNPASTMSVDKLEKLYVSAIRQRSMLDIDLAYTHSIVVDDNYIVTNDYMWVYTGYGTFKTDDSSLTLAIENSCTALLFGYEANEALNKYLSKVSPTYGNTKIV